MFYLIVLPTSSFYTFYMIKKLIPKDNYYKIALKIGLGILIVSLLFPFIVRYFAGNWADSGTFGDTFGALNAVFSGITVAGLVLTILMQRKELSYQRDEMIQTRQEFSVNRITNIIYNQLDRYEKALEQWTIKNDDEEYIGYDAVFFLDTARQQVTFSSLDQTPEPERKAAIKRANCVAMSLYSNNHISISQFALAAYNAIKVMQETLLSSTLSIKDMNLLKNLFFRNIGFIQLRILEDIANKYKEYLDLCNENGSTFLDECQIETGKLSRAYIYLKSVNEFRNTEINEAYVDNMKTNWTNHFGKHA
jgi:hypothetical protein